MKNGQTSTRQGEDRPAGHGIRAGGEGANEARGEERDPDEDEQRADQHEEQHPGRSEPVTEQPEQRGTRNPATASATAPTMRNRAKRPGGSVAPSRTAAIGGTRVARSAGLRLASRVTTIPTVSATTTVRVSRSSPLFGSVKPTRSNSANSPFASARPLKSPTTEASHSHQERLHDHVPEHLAAGGAEGSERRELARALRDRDRERVRDHERADEERDAAEREQELLEEGDEAARVRRVLHGLRCARPHLGARRQDRCRTCATSACGDTPAFAAIRIW